MGRTRESIYPGMELVIIDKSTNPTFDPPLRYWQVGTAGTLHVDTPMSSSKTIPAGCIVAGVQYVGELTKIYADSGADDIVGWR